jgi:multiple sugar transport system ATP-binding protein
MASIDIRGVSKTYGSTPVLDDIDLSIRDGEFIVLVGPSGCGKSTLLRMIAGLEDITRGTVEIDGKVMNDVPPKGRDIAMVFQSYALYPHMTVADNMTYSLRLRKSPKAMIAEKLRSASAKLGLDAFLARKPKALSGGQRQRVAMGRAIVRAPKAFLFDEPLSNLDARLREQMRAEIRKLHIGLGATSIYVTHDQVEAMTLADRIVAMNGGVIQQVGAPLELYDRPANLFVAGFIGSPGMNFMSATWDAAADVARLADGTPVPLGRALPIADGAELTLGVRPEHVQPAEHGALRAPVDLVEPTGHGIILHLRLRGQTFRVLTNDRRHLTPGEEFAFDLPSSRLQAFDANGRRID